MLWILIYRVLQPLYVNKALLKIKLEYTYNLFMMEPEVFM